MTSGSLLVPPLNCPNETIFGQFCPFQSTFVCLPHFHRQGGKFCSEKSQRGPQTSLWPIKIFLVFLSFQGGRGRCLSVRVLNMPIVKVRTIRLAGRREDEQIQSLEELYLFGFMKLFNILLNTLLIPSRNRGHCHREN